MAPLALKRARAFGMLDDAEVLEVVVKFTAEQAPYVQERVWHETQSLQVQADGSLLLHMQASGRFEIVRWILGWGEHVKVLEPRALRQEVAEHLRLAAQQYASHLRAPGAEEQRPRAAQYRQRGKVFERGGGPRIDTGADNGWGSSPA